MEKFALISKIINPWLTHRRDKKCIQKIWMEKSHEEKDNGRLRQKLRFNIKMDLEK